MIGNRNYSTISADEDTLRAIFESVEGAIWLLDTNRRLVTFNKHFAAAYRLITGAEPVEGMDMYGFLSDLGKQARDNAISKAFEGKKQVYEAVHKINNEVHYFRVSISPVKTMGQVTAVSCYAIDITESKLAHEALLQTDAYLNTIFNTTNIAYALFDNALNMLSFNNEAAAFAKRELNRDIKAGDYLSDFFYEDRRPSMEMASKGVFAGMLIDIDADFRQADGTMHWYNVKMYPVKKNEGATLGLMLAITDITTRKNAELQREKVTENLVQRNKDLEQFTYIVSHNLRAPVANIVGFASELTVENDPALQKEYVSELINAADKLDDVIRDLNDILQIKEINEIEKETITFTAMLDVAKENLKNMLFNEGIVIETDFAEVDEFFTVSGYMQNIFYNLLSNSVKYRRKNIQTLIQVKTHKKKDSILLTFKDNGLGIDLTKKANQVFGLYKRFHPTVADGKGMGLHITKARVESLGGTIKIESEVDKGTEFFIEFKL